MVGVLGRGGTTNCADDDAMDRLTAHVEGALPVEATPLRSMVREVCAFARTLAVTSPVDFAFIEDEDMALASEQVQAVLRYARSAAAAMKQSWAATAVAEAVAVRPRRLSFSAASAATAAKPPTSGLPETATRRPAVDKHRISKLALRVVTGSLGAAQIPPTPSMTSTSQKSLDNFAEAAHAFFMLHCVGSPRHRALSEVSASVLDEAVAVQRKAYQGTSKSIQYMDQRLRDSKAAVPALKRRFGCIWELSEFQVATYIGAIKGRTATASRARAALRWLGQITGAAFHADCQLVKQQLDPPLKGSKPKAKHAPPPGLDMVRRFEQQVTMAPTAQLRCIAGLMCLLCHASHRGFDGIRTRGMQLAMSTSGIKTFFGESLLKNSDEWEPWTIEATGFEEGVVWAEEWMQQLGECGLPADDYVVNGINATGDAWLPRHATTSDLEVGLRLLLQCSPHPMDAEQAQTWTVHGCRSLYITALTQLRATKGDRLRVGRWKPGSAMPERYDAAIGVAELATRRKVLKAVRDGWELAGDREFPMPAPKRSRTEGLPGFVINSVKGKVHIYETGSWSRCERYRSGTPDQPSAAATFQSQFPQGLERCSRCFREADA